MNRVFERKTTESAGPHERSAKMPNFFVVGAQKAGTTSLYYYLGQHPDVFMSPVKEPHYFDHGDEPPVYGGPGGMPGTGISTIEDYQRLFVGASEEAAVGEASPTYLYLPEAAGLIKNHVPDAKIIAILRDPAERAHSAYLHTARNGREPLRDFAAALDEEDRRVREGWHHLFHYRTRGYYHDQVSRFHDLFGRERVRVYLYEDLKGDPTGVAQDAFRFLGADDSFAPDVSTRYNATGVPRNEAVAALTRRARALTPALKKVLPFGVRQRMKGVVFSEAPPLDPEVRRRLVEGYREDVLKLRGLIGRDLSAWLR